MNLFRRLFNLWIPFPEFKPLKPGEYLCSIHQPSTVSKNIILYHDHVKVFYFDGNVWYNLQVRELIRKFNTMTQNTEKILYDSSIHPKNIVAFKRLPKIYKIEENEKT